jgi:methyltransferase (TIGR00027 family)
VSRRIETKTSQTAKWTCTTRAVSFNETNACYKSNDYIAPLLIPSPINSLIKLSFIRKLFGNYAPKGIYEYNIARTKYIDEVFQKAIENQFDQILLFGAGFDTRAIRFQSGMKSTRVFELDVPITQAAKIQQYKKRNIPIPFNIIFIPIDFEKDSLREKFDDTGFHKGQKSLFILEGLIMYLEPQSVAGTFKIIEEYAGEGSIIVFDCVFASVLRQERLFYGEEEIYQAVANANEQWKFGLEKTEIEPFLRKYGFGLIDYKDSKDLENTYFKNVNGAIIGRVNGTHFIVAAEKR